ncbi:uncharacterized protein LOC108044587 isoform X1 [Drosophila rhopaloa]|uniref:H15 domain-containing protein n=1 Tax=Drosophila rhopaloa TaxID=1041015 RepID=A0ABM5HEE8_DRORH|nr:uncharacterized protein LOC108044587 isoform X1 [Drosophila rhopaloa]
MDAFNVPKKVNRNVVKALGILQSSRTDYISIDDITHQVKVQMRNSKPVANVDEVIKESLCNLTNLGLLTRFKSTSYAISSPVFGRVGRALPNPNTNVPGIPATPQRRIVQNARRKRSLGNLNPWKPATKVLSEDSLSGNEMDKARKRMRSNTKRIVKKKPVITFPNQGPKPPASVRKVKPENDLGILSASESTEKAIRDPQPSFGSIGWTHPNLDTNILVIPGTTLPSEITKPRIPQNLQGDVCDDSCHAVSSLHTSCVNTTVMDNIMDLDEDEDVVEVSINCASPIGLNIRPTGYTSGGESDVENASKIALCGSPFFVQVERQLPHQDIVDKSLTINTNSSHSSVGQEVQLLVFRGAPKGIIFTEYRAISHEEVNSISRESNNLLPQGAAISHGFIIQNVQNSISGEMQSVLPQEESIKITEVVNSISQESSYLLPQDVQYLNSRKVQLPEEEPNKIPEKAQNSISQKQILKSQDVLSSDAEGSPSAASLEVQGSVSENALLSNSWQVIGSISQEILTSISQENRDLTFPKDNISTDKEVQSSLNQNQRSSASKFDFYK